MALQAKGWPSGVRQFLFPGNLISNSGVDSLASRIALDSDSPFTANDVEMALRELRTAGRFAGDWAASTAYASGQWVYYNEEFFEARRDIANTVTATPDNDTTNWTKKDIGGLVALAGRISRNEEAIHDLEQYKSNIGREFHRHLTEQQVASGGGLNNNEVVLTSAVSIDTFDSASTVTNDITGSTATLTLDNFAGNVGAPRRGFLQGELNVSAGSNTQWQQKIVLQIDLSQQDSALPNGRNAGFYAIETTRSAGSGLFFDETVLFLERDASGDGIWLQQRTFSTENGARRRNLSIGVRQGRADNAPHFQFGDVIKLAIEFHGDTPNAALTLVIVARVFRNGRQVDTIEFNDTGNGTNLDTNRDYLDNANQFRYGKHILFGGDAPRNWILNMSKVEFFQTNHSELSNLLRHQQLLDRLTDNNFNDEHRLLGFYDFTSTDQFNLNADFHANTGRFDSLEVVNGINHIDQTTVEVSDSHILLNDGATSILDASIENTNPNGQNQRILIPSNGSANPSYRKTTGNNIDFLLKGDDIDAGTIKSVSSSTIEIAAIPALARVIAWVASTAYADTQIVVYNNILYQAKQDIADTVSQTPDTDTTNWQALGSASGGSTTLISQLFSANVNITTTNMSVDLGTAISETNLEDNDRIRFEQWVGGILRGHVEVFGSVWKAGNTASVGDDLSTASNRITGFEGHENAEIYIGKIDGGNILYSGDSISGSDASPLVGILYKGAA